MSVCQWRHDFKPPLVLKKEKPRNPDSVEQMDVVRLIEMTQILRNKLAVAASLDKLINLLEKWGSRYRALNQILAHVLRLDIFQHNFGRRLLSSYAKLNKLVETRKLFDQMQNPDICSWNSLLNLYVKNKQATKALMLFSSLVTADSQKPDSHSIVAALSACAKDKDLMNGRIIHGMVYKYLEKSIPAVDNALIDMYGKNKRMDLACLVFNTIQFKDVFIWTSFLNAYLLDGDSESARRVFDEMPEKNVVSWTSMIVGYVRKKNPIEALKLFVRMRNVDVGEDCDPTTVTIVAILSGCADIGAFDLGCSIHGYANKRVGFMDDITVNNGLIDMYGKSGNLDSSLKIFNGMINKDLFSWTSMISGLALHGRGEHALLVFDSMLKSRIIPNEVTFLSVLLACSHSGMVTEGEKLFEKFVNIYHLKPIIEHYGCMVDLYCRAGHLDKAMQMIEQMPLKPDAVIWRSILGACLGNGNSELAEAAGRKVLELKPDDDSAYILLWSIYRAKGRREDALKAIKKMRDQRIKKTPGCSWIEVNGTVHEFVADAFQEQVHYDMTAALDGMLKQSKLDINHLYFEIV